MSVPDGEEGRYTSSRRRVYDALMAAAKGSPLEIVIARYAAETGAGPEDPVWEAAAPMLFGASIPKSDEALTAIVREAVRNEVIDLAGEVVEAVGREAAAPIFSNGVGKVVDAGIQTINQIAGVAKSQIAEIKASHVWWEPVVAASIAVMFVVAGAFGEFKYVHDQTEKSAVTAGYSQGYAAALRQHHLKK